MSRTTLKVVQPNGDVVNHKHYSNSWGFAPFVWNALCKRYLESKNWCGDNRVAEQLWALAKDPKVASHHRVVLQTTFDQTLIPPEMFGGVASAYRTFQEEFHDPQVVCHLLEIAEDLEHLPADCRGAAFYGTSVSADLWLMEGKKEEDRPYNIDRDTGHKLIDPP